MKETLQTHRAWNAKHERLVELEIGYQPLDDFRVRAGFNLEPDGIALAPLRHLGVNGVHQIASFFFFQVQIAVACYAKSRRSEDFITSVKPRRVRGHDVLQRHVVAAAFLWR